MNYIKYKRIEQICNTVEDIQTLLDNLIIDGFEIINYVEKKDSLDGKSFFFNIIIIAGKIKNNKLFL